MTRTGKRLLRGAAPAVAALVATLGLSAAPAAARLHPEAGSVATHGPGSPLRRGNRFVVEVRFDHGALAGQDELRAAGAQVLDASRRYQTITVAAKPGELPALGGVAWVSGVRQVLTPFTAAACSGSVTSEGDTQLNAAAARQDFGVDGSGVTVGILSDSFDRDPTAATHAAQDVASGDLPGAGNPCGHTAPVGVFDDSLGSSEATDEGRGMAQIVHDLAPGARIDFATAFAGETAFAESIRDLASAGASVIVDDVGYFEEPFFQDGPIAVAIDEVAGKGVAYFSAAGNDNLFEEEPLKSGKFNANEIGSWEAPAFRDAAECPAALKLVALTEVCLDFNPAAGAGNEDNTFGITVQEKEKLTVDVQWAEPWDGVHSDIDAYLLDEAGVPLKEGTALVGKDLNNLAQEGTPACEAQLELECQKPVEVFSWENTGAEQEVQLVVNRCFGTCNPGADSARKPRIKVTLLQNGGGVSATEYPKSSGGDVVGPTIFGHAGAASTVAVGAVQAGVANAPEFYSSRGPVTHYFGPVNGSAPAAPLVQGIPKPNLAATDCGRTTFFFPSKKTPGIFRFCGTSAAAPHAAAVAALVRQANPSLTPAQVLAAMVAAAKPVGAFGPNAVGAGLVDAYGALGGAALPPEISITEAPPALSRNRTPSISFAANRPVVFSCAYDGGQFAPCSSPFTPPEPLGDGLHGFVARGVDLAGRTGTSRTVLFTVDTVPPRTFITTHPRRTIRTRTRRAKAVFGFASNEPGATFTCRVDGGLSRFCAARLVKRFAAGRHVIRVLAVDAAGNVDPSPATFGFRVKRVGVHSGR